MMSGKKFDWEFRNGWRKDDRMWYGFTPIAFAIWIGVGFCQIHIGLLGFELFLYFGKLEDCMNKSTEIELRCRLFKKWWKQTPDEYKKKSIDWQDIQNAKEWYENNCELK
jgi:hypothetical protein